MGILNPAAASEYIPHEVIGETTAVAVVAGVVVAVDELFPSRAHATTTSSTGTAKNISLCMVWTASPPLDT
jgi:hypothetical protein